MGGLQSRTATVLALGAALVLAGCETFGRSTPEPSGETASTSATLPAPAPTRKQSAALAVPPVLDDDPQQLMELSSKRLRKLLGEPGLLRREGEATIWQYRDDTCVLDLFLYDQSGGRRRVTYVEARARDGTKTETRPCLNGLLHRQLVAVSAPTAAEKAAESAIPQAP